MKQAFLYCFPINLIIALLVVSCTSPPRYHPATVTGVDPNDPEWAIVDSKVKEVFAHIGSKKIGESYDMAKIVSERHTAYRCVAVMEVSDTFWRPYRLFFDSNFKLSSFVPMDLRLGTGIGFDSVKDRETREALIKAVNDFNRYLGFTYYDGPFIQEIPDSSYLVSFYTIPKKTIEENQKKGRWAADPYISFLVTADKKIFGVFWGS